PAAPFRSDAAVLEEAVGARPVLRITDRGLARPPGDRAERLDDGVEAPLVRHALELVEAAVLESDPRSRHEVLHGLRHEDLTRTCRRRHARCDVHGDPAELLPHLLALARVHAGPDVHA